MPDIISDGAAGANGAAGFDFNSPAGTGNPGQMANCSPWDDDCAQIGGVGGPGAHGGEGGPGGPGAHGGAIDIEVNSFSTLIKLSARGGAGGQGGRGGKGQDGGKGGRGGDGDDCEFGQHGGNGGPAGSGGIGGPGGNGGDGGLIVVRTKNVADGGLATIDVTEGAGGRPGDPGTPGVPGAPGDDGNTTGVFSASSDCPNMGPVPVWGALAQPTVPPSRAPGVNGKRGQVQFLQIA